MREDGSGFGTVHSVSTKITLNLRKSITRALHYGGTIPLRTSTILRYELQKFPTQQFPTTKNNIRERTQNTQQHQA
jgi:hypothetical protein